MAKKNSIKFDFKIESARLQKRINQFVQISGKSLRVALRDVATIFAQSAAKNTPPNQGSTNIPKKMYFRTIFDLKKTRGNKVYRFKVPYRTSKKKGRKYFSSRSEAKEFSKIIYRGIARAGWWGGAAKLGSPGTFKASPEVQSKLSEVSEVRESMLGFKPSIRVSNKAHNIERYAAFSATIGIRKASNRLNFLNGKIKRELEAKWRQSA